MSIDVNQFFQVFFDESEELLADMESLLLSINVASPDTEECNAIFRTAHSIKGGAATFGLKDMAEVTHVMESLLDKIRKGDMVLTAEHVDAFLQAKDILRMQLDGHRHKQPVDQEAAADVLMLLRALSTHDIVDMAPTASFAVQDDAPHQEVDGKSTASNQHKHRFRIELPETPEVDVKSLGEELGLMGSITRDALLDGRAVFMLDTDEKLDDLLAICAFVLDPDQLRITDASSTGAGDIDAKNPAAHAAVSSANNKDERNNASVAGAQKFLIKLPKMPEQDLDGLINELGMLGSVQREPQADGHGVLRLETTEPRDDVLAICSFAVDDIGQVTVSLDENPAAKSAVSKAVVAEEDDGFGLFVPVKPAPQPAVTKAPVADIEFFEPPAAASPEPVSAAAPAKSKEKEKSAVAAAKPAAAPAKEAPARAGASGGGGNLESSSIRVNLDKVDQLINLVGELVITQAMIAQHATGLDQTVHERMANSLATLARNTRDLQEAVMSIRMMPMDFVFSRFPRMVRDLASKLGKKVELISKGGATELDKGLIERIVDPLTHLVRNSIDHGIEVPVIRIAAGKPETGRLTLSAAHVSGNIVVEVVDDGAGLSRDRILKKARESGLPVSDDMRDEDVWQLIFAPGFSTAEVVTDVSGRGVGMDVVKRNILSMGGSVEIRSQRGQGTTIVISLPLTLAILEGMSIRSGDEVYILPLASVVESLKPSADNIRDVSGQGQVLRVRDEFLPLVFLHELFSIQPQCNSLSEGIAVVLEADGKKVALFVDGLVGQQQVVVKNLESNYRKTRGISGATILGDGSVSLILDIASLLHVGGQMTRNYERSITMH
ncbi:chemotaxis protein CheA [Candidatus Methylospira mobilis]|uniref:Chemotaxis protein CheA n=1 Tax=Candidatus Methylospira mobilis TaxID=1808979 RepID=A0A5Q0BJT5_9GAMM|nr:chemotaxis protein CheW [Candidatus Methylospira mobilis]QFY42444.1 chemotaxis protein CheA [Candidatus Methylospira mobilis]